MSRISRKLKKHWKKQLAKVKAAKYITKDNKTFIKIISL